MERTYINSLFNRTRSLPLEVSLDQATEWVNIQARTPAGKSNSWFNFLNSIIMVGIIIAIGAFCLTPSLTQPQTAAQLLTPKSSLEIPLKPSQSTFAMLELEQQEQTTELDTRVQINESSQLQVNPMTSNGTKRTVTSQNPEAPSAKAVNGEVLNPKTKEVVEPTSNSNAVYSEDQNQNQMAPFDAPINEAPAEGVSNHEVSFFADGHTGDWNNSISVAKENGVNINACQLKRNRKGVVKKLDMSIMVKRPEANYSYRGFLRINTTKFDRIDFAWDLLDDGSISNFRYSMDGGEFQTVDNVYSSCSKVKRR